MVTLLLYHEAPPGALHTVLVTLSKKNNKKLLEQVQRRPWGLQHLPCRDRLGELAMFSLERRRLCGNLRAPSRV